jgi:hypothetical protein
VTDLLWRYVADWERRGRAEKTITTYKRLIDGTEDGVPDALMIARTAGGPRRTS